MLLSKGGSRELEPDITGLPWECGSLELEPEPVITGLPWECGSLELEPEIAGLPRECGSKGLEPEGSEAGLPRECGSKELEPEGSETTWPRESGSKELEPEGSEITGLPRESGSEGLEPERGLRSARLAFGFEGRLVSPSACSEKSKAAARNRQSRSGQGATCERFHLSADVDFPVLTGWCTCGQAAGNGPK